MQLSYTFDPACRTWRRPDAADFGYSDGDAVEQRLLQVVESAADLRTGSRELEQAASVDWPSYYHLSPSRADLLRPVTQLLGGRVLEVGAGCGALTRYLGETGASVTAVEGSARRAAITASRCRDLENVQVVVDSLEDLECEGQFSAVTLVGVLEYSRVYSESAEAVERALARCRQLLAPGGVLVLAIENQLGLKYFAGAPEDHVGRPYAGLHDQYETRGPVTFGRRELDGLLRQGGFRSVDFRFPFPDYKHPRAVITQRGLDTAPGPVVDVLRASGAGSQGIAYQRAFGEELVWPVLARNGLGADLANSFLVVAAAEPGRRLTAEHELLSVYSTDRLRGFAKVTQISEHAKGLVARRHRLYDDPLPVGLGYRMRLEDEDVLAGVPYVHALQSLLARPGWTVDQVVSWALPWWRLLLQSADGNGLLPADWVDCIPTNIIRTPDGRLEPFDLEWVADEPPSVAFVLVRGLLCSLHTLRSVVRPAPDVPQTYIRVVSAVAARLGLHVDDVEVALNREVEFQAAVSGKDKVRCARGLGWPELPVRPHNLLARTIDPGLDGLLEQLNRQLRVLELVQAR